MGCSQSHVKKQNKFTTIKVSSIKLKQKTPKKEKKKVKSSNELLQKVNINRKKVSFAENFSNVVYLDINPSEALQFEIPSKKEELKYEKIRKIAEGGNSFVYIGKLNDILVAIKTICLKEDVINMKNQIQEIKNEISILSKVHHKNIIKYHSLEVNPQTKEVDIILEYSYGMSLRKLLDIVGSLKEREVKHVMKNVIEALTYLHDKDIIHCDIKASNILISKDFQLKITDFGSSKDMNQEKLDQKIKSSVFWLAPEVVNTKIFYKKSDIWSFGCMLIELITGSPPWFKEGLSVEQVLKKLKYNPEIKEIHELNVSQNLQNIIKKCLSIDILNRYSSKEILELDYFKEVINESQESEAKIRDILIKQFTEDSEGIKLN